MNLCKFCSCLLQRENVHMAFWKKTLALFFSASEIREGEKNPWFESNCLYYQSWVCCHYSHFLNVNFKIMTHELVNWNCTRNLPYLLPPLYREWENKYCTMHIWPYLTINYVQMLNKKNQLNSYKTHIERSSVVKNVKDHQKIRCLIL